MKKIYFNYCKLFTTVLFLAALISSCKKDHNSPSSKSLGTLGLYEVDSLIYKRIFIPITQVGTKAVNYYGVFDTGSSGMTLDATGIIPDSMITANGFVFAGDSVVVDGITITSKQAIVSYGNSNNETQEYGNLAYATVSLGNQNGAITTKRIPFFLYYKIVDLQTKSNLPAHSNDVFGVGPGVSFANSAIGSPLSYFATTSTVTSGYKLGLLNDASFSLNGTYVDGLLTIGLTTDDLAASSGFVMHQLTYYTQGGYSPDIASSVKYNGQTVAATVLFDTGTPAISLIENNAATSNISSLPAGTSVTITTNNGFTYQYTTAGSDNLTQIVNPSYTGDPRTIFSINFFTDNEFLMDYTNHRIGLKNK